jgi:PAS domain S-box-containing protein
MANAPINPPLRAAPPDFRLLFEALPGAFLVLDRDLHIRAASDDYANATLTSHDEIVGRHLFDVFPDNSDAHTSEDGHDMRASCTRVLERGVVDVMPLARHDVQRRPPESGVEERYWSPRNSPVLDEDGAVAYVIHHVEDVTELVKLREGRDESVAHDDASTSETEESTRLEAEIIARRAEVAALHSQLIEASMQAQQTEETLRAFLDFAPAAISMRDTAGRLVLRNRQFEARFERSEDSEDQLLPDSVMTPEFTAWQAARERQVIETGMSVSAETDVPAEDGTSSVSEFTKFPLRTPAGVVYAVGTIATDVTEARRAHTALAASEERLRQMADNVDEVLMLSEEGTTDTLYVSPAVKRIVGLDAAQFRDPVARLEIVHPDDRALARSSPAGVKEFRITGPNGDLRWIRSRTSVIETAEGLPNRGVTTLTDFTERKLAELAAHLAQADAEAANRAKSVFLSRMSHELRTPLNVIIGFGQLLQMGELREEQRDGVDHIIGAGRHLLGLVDSVLDITGAETGDLRLSLEPVSMRDVTDDAVGMIRPLADLRHLRVVMDFCKPDSYVAADRQRLRQVLLNLLANAVKYNREGGQVRIECTDLGQPDRVRLTVSDTGPGIAEQAQTRLFQPFERLTAEQSAIEGSGLGLALAKQLITAMSGQIGVISRPGEGSSFWIELPATSPPSAGETRPSHRAVDQPPPTPIGDKIVLYVEDNPTNVRLVERLVERRPGVELIVAVRGELGLELAVQRRPDLILLDLHLPDMRGEDVLRALRADPRTAGTPIVVLSADATAAGPAQLREAGATDFLTKPFDARHLLAVIDATSARPRPTPETSP